MHMAVMKTTAHKTAAQIRPPDIRPSHFLCFIKASGKQKPVIFNDKCFRQRKTSRIDLSIIIQCFHEDFLLLW